MGDVINLHYYRREVVTMCRILRQIHGKTAEQLLKDYGAWNTLPVDLEEIANSIGISILPHDFSDLEKDLGKKDILGMIMTDGDNAAIFYKKSDPKTRIRFTIAHELAHCCNIDPDRYKIPHIEYRMDKNEKDDTERKMDIFAGELLIPFHKLKEVYLRAASLSSIQIAKEFEVSASVMEARLNYLKISHFNRKGEPVIYG